MAVQGTTMNAQFLLDSDGPTHEFIAWMRSHFVAPASTLPESIQTLELAAVVVIAAGIGIYCTGRILHALTYRPRNGDITVERGVATLHLVTRKRRR